MTVIKLLFNWFSHVSDRHSQAHEASLSALLRILKINPSGVLSVLIDHLLSKNISDKLVSLNLISHSMEDGSGNLAIYIPKIMECIIRMLDPSIPYVREAVMGPATAVLYEFVKK